MHTPDHLRPPPDYALGWLWRLTAQQHRLQASFWRSDSTLRPAIWRRLVQIEHALGYVWEERRRLRAGAPPAPPDYDPFTPVVPFDPDAPAAIPSRAAWATRVAAIRADYQQGQGLGKPALAEKYGLSLATIRRILRDECPRTAHLEARDVQAIRARYAACKGQRGIIGELAATYQVHRSTIFEIVTWRTWRNLAPLE